MVTKKARPVRGLKGLVGGNPYFVVGVRYKKNDEIQMYLMSFIACGVPRKDEDCYFVGIKSRNKNTGKIHRLEMCLDIMGVIGNPEFRFERVYQHNSENLKVLSEFVAENDIAGYQKMIGVDIFY